MLENLFLSVLNMSLTACIVIAAVILARLLLKKAPRALSYGLWTIVLFRLLCPISFESAVSLIPSAEVIPTSVITAEKAADIRLDSGISAVDSAVTPILQAAEPASVRSAFAILSTIWLIGMAAMLIYSGISLILLLKKIKGAEYLRDNIYLTDRIRTPFVLGLFRPRIYLPLFLKEADCEQEYILLHERTHIRRGDHIIKLIAYAALILHWFNPAVWIAFALACGDMEASCDERVMNTLGDDIRRNYSASLLNLAAGRKIIAGAPLAFGEGSAKSRIRHVMAYKKPAQWITAAALVLIGAVFAACSGNPISPPALEVTFPAYEIENPNNLPFYDKLNAMEPFQVKGLPDSWEVRAEAGEGTPPMGEFYISLNLYEGDTYLGYIGFNTFVPYPDDIPQEYYYQTVWSSLRLSSMFRWDPYTAVKETENGEIGVVEIDSIDPEALTSSLYVGQMPDVPHIQTNGILGYNKELGVYIGIGFVPGVMDAERAAEIAAGIEIVRE